jgi:hypothetical protein
MVILELTRIQPRAARVKTQIKILQDELKEDGVGKQVFRVTKRL